MVDGLRRRAAYLDAGRTNQGFFGSGFRAQHVWQRKNSPMASNLRIRCAAGMPHRSHIQGGAGDGGPLIRGATW